MGTPFKLRNGMLLLSTEAPGGIYNSTQLKKIAALCDGDSALVKATEDQRLALFVLPAKAKAVAAELKAVGLGIRDYQDGLHQPVNCIGELCSEHLQDAMGAAMDLSQELAKVTLGSPLKIGINGCARSCVPTHTLDVSVVGDTSGYRICLGGKNSQLPEMASFMAEGVPAAKLPKLIAKVIGVYRDLAQKDETLQEVMERCGSKRFIEALAPYSQDAHQSDDPFGAPAEEAPEAAPGDGLELELAPERETDTFGMSGIDINPAELGDGDATGLDVPIHGDDGLGLDDTIGGPAAVNGGSAGADEIAFDDPIDELALEEAPMGAASAGDELALDEDLALDAQPAGAGGAGDELALDDDLALEEIPAGGGDELALDDDLALDAVAADAGGDELALDDAALEDPAAGFEVEELSLDDASAGDADLAAGDDLALDALELGDDPLDGIDGSGTAVSELAIEEEEMIQTDGGELAELPADGELLDEPLDGPLADAAGDDFEEIQLDEIPEPLDAPAPARPVAAAPQPAAAAPAAEADDLSAEEVGEDEADAFEEKLNASIAEEEAMPEAEDVNSHARLEAMRLIEAGGDERGGGSDFEDLQIESDPGQLGDDEDMALDSLALDEPELIPQSDSRSVSALASKAAKAPRAPERPANGGGFAFSGFDLAPGGKVTLSFTSGAQITVDPAAFARGPRELTIGGTHVRIAPRDGGLSVEIDGVAIFLPALAA